MKERKALEAECKESSGILNTINHEMDKVQDEEGIQCRPAARDVASKHLEDNTNLVGTTTSRTSGRKQRPERADDPPRAARERGWSTAVRRSCTSSTWQEEVLALAETTPVCQCPDSTSIENDSMAPQVTQIGRSYRRVTGRKVLTDHQYRAQRNTRVLGHGGSQEESSAHKRLKPRRDVRLDAEGGTELQRPGSVRMSIGWASPDLWTATTKSTYDVKSRSQR